MKTQYEETILELLEPGDTVYAVLRSVSRSGMRRVIELVIFPTLADEAPEPRWVGRAAAEVLGRKYDQKREGVIVDGAGMDMGFELVYSLGQAMFGDGYALTVRWI